MTSRLRALVAMVAGAGAVAVVGLWQQLWEPGAQWWLLQLLYSTLSQHLGLVPHLPTPVCATSFKPLPCVKSWKGAEAYCPWRCGYRSDDFSLSQTQKSEAVREEQRWKGQIPTTRRWQRHNRSWTADRVLWSLCAGDLPPAKRRQSAGTSWYSVEADNVW